MLQAILELRVALGTTEDRAPIGSYLAILFLLLRPFPFSLVLEQFSKAYKPLLKQASVYRLEQILFS